MGYHYAVLGSGRQRKAYTVTSTLYSETLFTSTLPGRYYYDEAIYKLEQERIFSNMWLCVGRAEVIAEPGEYRTIFLMYW